MKKQIDELSIAFKLLENDEEEKEEEEEEKNEVTEEKNISRRWEWQS